MSLAFVVPTAAAEPYIAVVATIAAVAEESTAAEPTAVVDSTWFWMCGFINSVIVK